MFVHHTSRSVIDICVSQEMSIEGREQCGLRVLFNVHFLSWNMLGSQIRSTALSESKRTLEDFLALIFNEIAQSWT